ncbi:hypothetical protein N9509_02415 [Amylibacter sp.]|nr:hypothetical protein [Amylibacter sp.]
MEINARILNDDGISAIKRIFSNARVGLASTNIAANFKTDDFTQINNIIYDDKFTIIAPDTMIDPNRIFSNRLELGLYLNSVIDKKSSLSQYENVGFWTWISALYLNQILEQKKSKSEYKLWTDVRYIPHKKLSKLRWYRHLCYLPYHLCSRRPASIAEFFLMMEPYKHSENIEKLWTQDKEFSSSLGVIEVAKELYIDKKTKEYRKKYTGDGPGSAKRLANVIVKQWQMNYDVNMLSRDQVWDLLPKEFDGWKKLSTR